MLEWTGERYLPWMLGVGAEIHYEHLQRYALALQFVKGKRVLDFGSGEGYGSFLLAREAADVIGIDIDAPTVRHARSRYGHLRANLTFIEGSITDVPLSDDDAFDVVVCFEALEHVADHPRLLAEVRRLLKPGGQLVLSTPNRHVYSDKPGYRNQFHVKELYFDEFQDLLREHFRHTAVLGQSVYAGSFTWALRGCEGVNGREVVIERGAQGYRYAGPDQKEPRYFIGIASDAPLPDIASENRLLDVSNGYLEEFVELQVNPRIRALENEAAGLRSNVEEQRTQITSKNLELDQLRGEIQRLVAASLPPPPGTRQRNPERRRADDRQLQHDFESTKADLGRLAAQAAAKEHLWAQERLDVQRQQAERDSKATDAAGRLAELVEAQKQDRERYRAETVRLQQNLEAQQGVARALSEQLRARDDRMRSDADALAGLRSELADTRLAADTLVNSRSWRLTTPLRRLRSALPAPRRAPLRLELDEPSETRHLPGTINVWGWAFGPRPVTRIELVCDGNPVAVTEVGLPRPDVGAAFPHAAGAERSGFAWAWDASQLTPGSHRLTIRAVDSQGQVATVARDIDIGLPLTLSLDEPPPTRSHVSGSLTVSGWAVGPSAVVEVAVTCLGEQLGVTRVGLPRPDVAAAYPDLTEAAWSGFALTIDRSRLPPGRRTLVVRAVDAQRRVATVTRHVIIDAEGPGSEPNRNSGRLQPRARRGTLERVAVYVSSFGNYFFAEIADLLAAGLKELGLTVETRTERDGFAEDADCHIVIAPHEFFYLGTGAALLQEEAPRLVLVNTEQPSTPWFARAFECLAKADAIWDISYECAQLIVRLGYPCRYLALGYSAQFEAARAVARLPDHYGTCFLEPEIRESAGAAFAERPIDVLFIGHASPRREQFFADAAATLSRYRCYLHFSSAAEPIIPGQTTHMDTATVLGLAQRSKILLNIHHGDDLYFEWHRIVIEGIWQRALVISEPCGVAPPFQPGVDFVEAPLDELPATIAYYLSTPEGQSQAETIIEHAFRTLTERCRLTENLQPLILELSGEPVEAVPALPGTDFRTRIDAVALAHGRAQRILPKLALEEVRRAKISLIADIGVAESIRDYGGMWRVLGLYLFEGAKALKCRYAQMVDVAPVDEFLESARARQAPDDSTVVEMIQADFRDPALYFRLPPVDVSLLYEVLLHQDNPEEVIKRVLSRTRQSVCLAQPVLNEKMLGLPGGMVCLQFYTEELKDLLRFDWWPKEPRTTAFDNRYWMWGQTVSYFEAVFLGYGWTLEHLQVHEMTEAWNYALMRFVPRNQQPAEVLGVIAPQCFEARPQ